MQMILRIPKNYLKFYGFDPGNSQNKDFFQFCFRPVISKVQAKKKTKSQGYSID